MLNRIRLKFTALTMGIVAVVLTVVSAGVFFADTHNASKAVYDALDMAVAANSRPLPQMAEDASAASSTLPGADEEATLAIAVYLLPDNGSMLPIDTTMLSLDETTLTSVADALQTAPEGHGALDDDELLYCKHTVGEYAVIAFTSASSVQPWHKILLHIALIEAITLALLVVATWLLSKPIAKPIVQAWERQQRFIADASHELKTPLAVILANSSIVMAHPEKTIASQSRWLESTRIAAMDMRYLVSDMLELASLENDPNGGEEPELLDYSDLVEGILLQFESLAYEQGVLLQSDIADNVFVLGRKGQLMRLVETLVDNACKYSGPDATVAVSLIATAKTAELRVTNPGPTIPEEDLAHVFDRFYRVDKARTRGTGSYGLGLAIARETARSLSGDITVESDEGHGTTFTATLPLSKPPHTSNVSNGQGI